MIGHKNRPQCKDLPDVEVLKEMDAGHYADGSAPWRRLAERYHVPEKVVYAKMEKLYDRGLIDFGVSLRTGWPSDRGRALIVAAS